jgi:hypothetical protein
MRDKELDEATERLRYEQRREQFETTNRDLVLGPNSSIFEKHLLPKITNARDVGALMLTSRSINSAIKDFSQQTQGKDYLDKSLATTWKQFDQTGRTDMVRSLSIEKRGVLLRELNDDDAKAMLSSLHEKELPDFWKRLDQNGRTRMLRVLGTQSQKDIWNGLGKDDRLAMLRLLDENQRYSLFGVFDQVDRKEMFDLMLANGLARRM